VLVGHSFSGMIVSEVGLDRRSPPLSTSRAAPMPVRTIRRWQGTIRCPRPQEALSSTTIGPVVGRRLLRTSGRSAAGGGAVLYAVSTIQESLTTEKDEDPLGVPSRPSMPCPPKTGRSIPDLERLHGQAMGAKTIEINASHWR